MTLSLSGGGRLGFGFRLVDRNGSRSLWQLVLGRCRHSRAELKNQRSLRMVSTHRSGLELGELGLYRFLVVGGDATRQQLVDFLTR